MKKYIVVEDSVALSCRMDSYVFDTIDEANDFAEREWRHLTSAEREKCHFFVGVATEGLLMDEAFNDEDDSIDWACWRELDCEDGAFDSATL